MRSDDGVRSTLGASGGQALAVVALALVVGVLAAVGVLARGDLATETVTTPRGEEVEFVTEGIYAHNPERLVAEGVGWDAFTLVAVVPALLVFAPGLARGSLRARLLVVGLLAYLAYQYLMYAMAWAVGPLLLAFVAVFAASWLLIVWTVRSVDVDRLAVQVADRFPRRSAIALCGVMAVVLVGLWVPMIVAVNRGELTDNLRGQTTLVVQAMDLGILVPLTLGTAALLWRRAAAGYLVASVVVVKAVAMSWAIVAMVVVAWRIDDDLDVGGLGIFVASGLASIAILVAMLRAVGPETSASQSRTSC